MKCLKCAEHVIGQPDFNVVTNSDDETIGVLCDDHMDEYVFWLATGLNPEEALSTTG